ncbi:MAG TPA: nitrate ABC transporter, permease protein, partial [Terriglobia bacterium]|nr:nitrate ABC transporter, permease protein [Terriglobia bacterium]
MKDRLAQIVLPIVGVLAVMALWAYMSTTVQDLPSPLKTWQDSKIYITAPLVKRGEMDQGILLLAYQSLIRVA